MKPNIFCERLVDFIHRTATGSEKKRRLLMPLFAGFFSALILFIIIGSLFLDRFFGLPRFIPGDYGRVGFLPFFIVGTFLWGWSVLKLLGAKGTPIPVQPPQRLVTDGPYAYSRNPMLTGVFLLLAGTGILTGSIVLTFVATPVFVLISVLEFKNIEEPELERRFGEAYREYREKTPVVLPRLRRR